ncbi:DUF805 domain-containing protein [Jannaschia marina]|uniref:DUF805 domain-containing protein n=1 Tax=Jannaschia marina TaxID=2741674 RepID=UPI0015CC87FF|nr:DUF805 domain-containing protein [Jannaschia marina]
MTFAAAVVSAYRGAFDATGRADRSEYWWFVVFGVIAGWFGMTLVLAFDVPAGVLLPLFLSVFVPSVALTVRRLHDIDRSGWWYLIGLVPFGGLLLLIFTVLPGTPGDNRFGPPPNGGRRALVGYDDLDVSYDRTGIPRVRPEDEYL